MHTAGPWFVGPTPFYLMAGQNRDSGARRFDPVTIRSNEHTEEIATVWTYLLPTEDNARLIAAAPEVLEALTKITDHFAAVMGGPMISGQGVTFENGVEGIPTIAAARAAIAKATGA